MFVDSHCHIYDSSYENFLEGREVTHSPSFYSVNVIVNRAKKANVQIMVNIGTTLSDVEELRTISCNNEGVYKTVGIHPQFAKEHVLNFSTVEIQKIFETCADEDSTVGIGEIGLDYYTDNHISEQKKIFDFQLSLAEQLNLPVSIHTRNAWQDTIDILELHPNVKGVIHCFSGEYDFAKKVLDIGYAIGVGGIVTFNKSLPLQETVRWFPLDSILLETDSPWLSPVPFRGKVNEPARIPSIAEKIANLKKISVEEIEQNTTENFFKVFPKAKLGANNE